VLAAAVYSEGALVALRTAAQFIGWFLAIAALSGLAGLRRAHFGQLGATSVALCSAAGLLYMSYFLDWRELPQSAIRHAAAEPLPVRLVEQPVPEKKIETTRKVVVAATRPPSVPRPANPCAALSGVEALQCDRCADKSALSLVACHEQVRLDYCASEAGDERICPSPIPSSYPG